MEDQSYSKYSLDLLLNNVAYQPLTHSGWCGMLPRTPFSCMALISWAMGVLALISFNWGTD